MKYFVDADGRAASGHEDYIEFQLPSATEEFWDGSSLYMAEAVIAQTGFGEFWSDCMYDGIVFDMGGFSKAELAQMAEKAAGVGGTVLEVMRELTAWLEPRLNGDGDSVAVYWADDRALARRRAEREAYPVDPEFYNEVRALDPGLSFGEREEAYEALLRKYNMPDCFFPFPLYEPEKW